MSCENTVGSYNCICIGLEDPHFPIPDFTDKFHYGLSQMDHAADNKVLLKFSQKVFSLKVTYINFQGYLNKS